jgi:hypothetical protein
MQINEYFIKIWGGAFNSDANPSIEKDHGIKEGVHYFEKKSKLDEFKAIINKPEYSNQGLISIEKYGQMTHKRTIAVVTCGYKGKEYVIDYDFGYEYEEDQARYMFEDGNYSCDCNLSLFLNRKYPDDDNFKEEFHCGYEIEIKDISFRYED